MKRSLLLLSGLLITQTLVSQNSARFEPPAGKTLLIVGQDLDAIGGFEDVYDDGYTDNIGIVPGGITTYVDIPSLGGMRSKTNYGSGDVCGQCIIENPKYNNSVLAIGLYLVNQLEKTAEGKYDAEIRELGGWIRNTQRPVFLRIGYEFDGEWNSYEPGPYKKAFRHIVDIFREMHINNFVAVWQSSGRFEKDYLMQWYPGDEYVDWLAYSHFDNHGKGMLDIARDLKKPILIAESTPIHYRTSDDGEKVWKEWFEPFVKHIHDNQDVIKAVAYINTDWAPQPMWKGQNWGDSRIQADKFIRKNWITEIKTDFWLNASPSLFKILGQ